MKKIITISALIISACFFSVSAEAQLASSQPALTPAQMQALKSSSAAQRGSTPSATAQTASSTKSPQLEAIRKKSGSTEAKTSTEPAGVKHVVTVAETKPVAEAAKQSSSTPTDEQPAGKANKGN